MLKTFIPYGTFYYNYSISAEADFFTPQTISVRTIFKNLIKWGFWIFLYFIQHCFICRPSDSTVSNAGKWDRIRTVATLALAVSRSNHSARSHPLRFPVKSVSNVEMLQGPPGVQSSVLTIIHCMAHYVDLQATTQTINSGTSCSPLLHSILPVFLLFILIVYLSCSVPDPHP